MGGVLVSTCDTATKFDERHRGAVVVCGSHGGAYPAYLAARARLRAVVLADAGVGKDRAGIQCLDYCRALGMAAATVDSTTARIADAADMLGRGRISHVNPIAASVGCEPGQPVREATEALAEAPLWSGEPPAYVEGRKVVRDEPGRPRVICVDSVSLVEPADAGQIVIGGSHGALVGGRPESALEVDALAALFNDAGIGIDETGASRLPVLERRGIAAGVVDVHSARIGDALSTYEDGALSRVNASAEKRGARPGMTARAFVELFG